MSFRPTLASSSTVNRTAPKAVLYLATENGAPVETPNMRDAKDAAPQGRLDRMLAVHLANTGRAPENMFFDDGFWADRHGS
ncbi:MAG TPA: hypothetical protein V6C76_01830 [Drouetiella sp.]